MTLSSVNVKSVARNAQLHSQNAEDVAGYQVKLVNHDITRGKKQLHPLEAEHTRKALFIGCVRGCSISGLTGIFNRKSWVKAMRYFRAVSAALLKRFLSSGPKIFEEMEEYLAIARLHPGMHWVDNFFLPTLLIHQYERAEREGDYFLKESTMEWILKYFQLHLNT